MCVCVPRTCAFGISGLLRFNKNFTLFCVGVFATKQSSTELTQQPLKMDVKREYWKHSDGFYCSFRQVSIISAYKKEMSTGKKLKIWAQNTSLLLNVSNNAEDKWIDKKCNLDKVIVARLFFVTWKKCQNIVYFMIWGMLRLTEIVFCRIIFKSTTFFSFDLLLFSLLNGTVRFFSLVS